jgi:phage shock protein A
MKDATRNIISNHIGDASAAVQQARQSLAKARKLSRGKRREMLEEIHSDLGSVMTDLSTELDDLEPDGCPF